MDMDRRTSVGIALIVFVLSASALGAQDLGRIVYIEGDVQLVRDSSVQNGYQLNIGDTVRELDVIQTGYDGFVEIEILRPQNSVIKVQENAAYYVETIEDDAGRVTTRLKVLSGSVEIAVDRIAPSNRYVVETRSAVMGVRGTVFDVLTAPDESTLLGVREGRVAIASDAREMITESGHVAESTTDQTVSIQPVPNGDFDRYYDRWTEIRLQMFRNGASTFVRAYARRYLDSIDSFQESYQKLVRYRPALEDAVEHGGSLGQDMQLRREISPALIAMRSILPIFENTVYRLRELRRFHDQGIGTTSIDGRSSQDFFRRFAADEGALIAQLAEVRTIFRLYRIVEKRSFGGLPGSMGSPFNGDGNDILNNMSF